jgi:ADP-ribosylglycohydrolase
MKYPTQYPKIPDMTRMNRYLQEYARLKFEYGADKGEIEKALEEANTAIGNAAARLKALPEDASLAAKEPDALESIRKLRSKAVRSLWRDFDRKKYLDRIPAGCMLAGDIRWALEAGAGIANYAEARRAVEERFMGMERHHTNLNACLTVFGLMIGGEDFTKVISQTVAMGYDNDCTAATAGSIFGAARGIAGIPEHWYKGFNNKILTYINGHPELAIDDIIRRFAAQAEKSFASA